jgi:sigma-B regulation protein RsbU (phosphoserine phosphatase)
VVVADASDHGVQAALLMASVRAYLRQRLAMPGDPAAAAAEVNRQLCRDVQDTGGFMTMLCCRFDGAGREVAWVRAGHEPGLLYDPEKDDFEELAGPGPALGLDEDANYTTGRRRLVPGQVLLLGTDGVWEVHDDAGRMLGREAVKAVIREHSAGSAEDMVQAVMDRIFAFRGPADKTPVQDDITLVVVKVLPDKEA